jgi:hypothetical protein
LNGGKAKKTGDGELERDNRATIAWLLASAAVVMVLPSVGYAQALANATAAADKPTAKTTVDT